MFRARITTGYRGGNFPGGLTNRPSPNLGEIAKAPF